MTECEIEQLRGLNEALKLVTARAKEMGLESTRALMDLQNSNGGELCSFHLVATVSYDRKWDDEDPNAIGYSDIIHATRFLINFSADGSDRRWEPDMEFAYDRPAVLQDMIPVWLMHELYKSKEDGIPEIPLHDCLKIDTINLTVTQSQTYVLDVQTKQWLKNIDVNGDDMY